MPVTPKVLIPAKQAENTDTTQYTAVNCKALIDKFTATNTTASAVTLTLNIIPQGGSAQTSNIVMSARSIAPGETYLCPEVVGLTVDSNGFISTIASSASALTIFASGREVT